MDDPSINIGQLFQVLLSKAINLWENNEIQGVLGKKLLAESVARISGDHSPALFSSF